MIPSSTNADQIRWTLTDLAPGESRTIEYVTRAESGGIFMNRAHIDAYAVDGSDSVSRDISAAVDISEIGNVSAWKGWQPPDWDFIYPADMAEYTCDQFCELWS